MDTEQIPLVNLCCRLIWLEVNVLVDQELWTEGQEKQVKY